MPALMGLVDLPHASPKRIKVIKLCLLRRKVAALRRQL